MKRTDLKHYKLIITVALKKEVPKEWFVSHGVPVYTIEALRSGAHVSSRWSGRGIMVVVTGAGAEASAETARWIRDNLDPRFVLNIGTCGVLHHDLPLREWMRPRSVINESGDQVELDTRSLIPVEEKVIDVHSLLTVKEALPGKTADPLKKCGLVDMECFSQAAVFKDTDISFHTLKLGTDYADEKAIESFNENLGLFVERVKDLFDFIAMNEQNVKVSVVIPVYSREHTIKRAIDSVLAQSYQADEVIVVDDDSTDRTFSLLKGYGRKIKIISLSKNAGPSKARNEGVRFARNEWIAFLDSDDEWEKDKLKKQVRYLTTYPFYEIMQSDEKWIRNNIRVNQRKYHVKKDGWMFDESLERCMISPSSVLVRRSLLERYGQFDEELPVCEDYDLWLKITRYHPVGFDPNMSVIKYGGHEDQLSRKFPMMDRFRVGSLHKLLKNEPSQRFRNKILPVLEKKLKILIGGCEKRDKMLEARELRDLLGSVSDEGKTVTTDHG
jgi:glycosyltransferase involved in cell wall biosynthesis/nucleoside phosphorylase